MGSSQCTIHAKVAYGTTRSTFTQSCISIFVPCTLNFNMLWLRGVERAFITNPGLTFQLEPVDVGVLWSCKRRGVTPCRIRVQSPPRNVPPQRAGVRADQIPELISCPVPLLMRSWAVVATWMARLRLQLSWWFCQLLLLGVHPSTVHLVSQAGRWIASVAPE